MHLIIKLFICMFIRINSILPIFTYRCMFFIVVIQGLCAGLVFLQYRSETKRALLPNEITSIDTVKALFVRSFPKQLSMQYMDSPVVKIYIHDSSKDMFYELEDVRYVYVLFVVSLYF